MLKPAVTITNMTPWPGLVRQSSSRTVRALTVAAWTLGVCAIALMALTAWGPVDPSLVPVSDWVQPPSHPQGTI